MHTIQSKVLITFQNVMYEVHIYYCLLLGKEFNWIRLYSKETWLAQHNLFSFYVKMYRVLWKYLLRKKKNEKKNKTNGNTYRDRVEAAERKSTFTVCPTVTPSLYFALSLSIQRNMYNYKGYKKGSNINRQIYWAHFYMPLKCKEVILYTQVKKRKKKNAKWPLDICSPFV